MMSSENEHIILALAKFCYLAFSCHTSLLVVYPLLYFPLVDMKNMIISGTMVLVRVRIRTRLEKRTAHAVD